MTFAAWPWQSQDVFIGGGGGGLLASNQPEKSTLFIYKNVVDYNLLDYFSA